MITIAQSLFEEGRQQGLAEAREEGFLEGKLSALRILGGKRFGPPNELQAAELNGLTDIDQIDLLTDRLFDVHSWEEVRFNML